MLHQDPFGNGVFDPHSGAGGRRLRLQRGRRLILLTAAFVSVFFTLLMLNEGKQKAATVSVPQILASPGIAYAMFPLCGVMYYVMCLYGIRKAGNVSFLREQPGYGH